MPLPEWLTGFRQRRRARQQAAEEARLLKLYWNRVGLKRALDDQDEEIRQLRDLLRQQQGSVQRATDDAEALEQTLANPELGFGALLHFSLRGLWRMGRAQLQQLTLELQRQQEDRERKQQIAQLQLERKEQLQAVDLRIGAAVERVAIERAVVATEEREFVALSSPWQYFRRKEALLSLNEARGRQQEATLTLENLRASRALLVKTPLHEFPGLSVAGRRAVNLAVIALTQVLAARLAQDGLAAQVRLAWQRDLSSIRYGGRADCLARLAEVNAAVSLLRTAGGIAEQLRLQLVRLQAVATYRSGVDTLPQSTVLDTTEATLPGSLLAPAQLLAEDYFEVKRFLLH